MENERLSDLFLNEDLGSIDNPRPENRVNVALFSVLQHDWFREWFLESLDLPLDCIVYPPTNLEGRRPDFKVANPSNTCQTLAWIEVELGKDENQLRDYSNTFSEPVKSLWGKRCHGGCLSLEEVAEFLDSPPVPLSPQTSVNVTQLKRLIRNGIDRIKNSGGRAPVSQEMRTHPLVRELVCRLKARIDFELGSKPPPYGKLKADTTASPNNRGFSLRVFSPESTDNTLSVLAISAGRDEVIFPSPNRLQAYLREYPEQTNAFKSAIEDIGGTDISDYGLRDRISLRLSVVLREQNLDKLVPSLENLAKCYGG